MLCQVTLIHLKLMRHTVFSECIASIVNVDPICLLKFHENLILLTTVTVPYYLMMTMSWDFAVIQSLYYVGLIQHKTSESV